MSARNPFSKLRHTPCCWFGLIAALIFASISAITFSSFIASWEDRINRLEKVSQQLVASSQFRTKSNIGILNKVLTDSNEASVRLLERRVIALEQKPSVATGTPTGRSTAGEFEQCNGKFGELSSLKSMIQAGWLVNVEDIEFDPGILAWTGGMGVGKMSAIIYHAGVLTMKVSNPHDAKEPSNYVGVSLNDEQIMRVGPSENKKLCLSVRPGDQLRIVEKYGKIWLRNVNLQCSEPSALNVSSSKLCSAGHRVKWKSRLCDKETWVEGRIEKILSRNRASLVRSAAEKGSPSGANILVASAMDLIPLQNQKDTAALAPAACTGFEFQESSVGIVVISNGQFLKSYESHIKSQKCFAKKHGYDHWILKPGTYDACDDVVDNIFYEKHCIVAEFLKERPPGYVAAVIDADVMAVVLERGLEDWLSNPADLMFYERDIQSEIAAGNYIARNTPVAHDFLHKWARFKFKQPPGFSSADNGAIHLHLIETLQLVGHEHCGYMYGNLTALVDNLSPYFAYVACALRLLGQARTWNLPGGGAIAIWPRLGFFVVDGFVLNRKYNDLEGPVMHHGIKNKEEASQQYSNFDHCLLNAADFRVNRGELGRIAMGFVKRQASQFKKGTCTECPDVCLPTMSCRPLRHDQGKLQPRKCGSACSR